jgi:hypothetical protein
MFIKIIDNITSLEEISQDIIIYDINKSPKNIFEHIYLNIENIYLVDLIIYQINVSDIFKNMPDIEFINSLFIKYTTNIDSNSWIELFHFLNEHNNKLLTLLIFKDKFNIAPCEIEKAQDILVSLRELRIKIYKKFIK